MDHDPDSGRGRSKRSVRRQQSGEESPGAIPCLVLVGISLVGVVCLAIGGLRRGLAFHEILAVAGCIATGIGFIAAGLFEIEWLEKVVDFLSDFLVAGLARWFWGTDGTLSETIGRRRAAVVWMAIGFPVFTLGCLMACRILIL